MAQQNLDRGSSAGDATAENLFTTFGKVEANFTELYGWGDHGDAGYLTSYTVTESDVTGHQAALSITESQISDLQSYLTSAPVDSVAGLLGAITATALRSALGIESGATADQTGAEIRALLAATADTNILTDALLATLNLTVASDITGITGASVINNTVFITQAAYDALGSYDANTHYVIAG